ncbi:MAG TPA: GTA-gp10 family protein [Candidatus Binatia bacterium]|nr:GTA-gp10 family protein [Candidatus Binatia bacterium]
MRELVNAARGEALLEIDGRPQRLCVTLGALAELEAAFDVASLFELGERLAQLTASDLITVLAALSGTSTAELARAEIDPKAAAHAVAEAFRVAFDD